MTIRTLRNSLFCGAAGLAMAAGAAMGQEASASEDEPQASRVRDVIVVTAQKREETIQDIPASISVIGGAQLENLAAKSLTDYAAYAPGFNVDGGGSPGQASLTLRGVAPIGPGSTVGTYIDDAPLGSSANYARASAFALDLFPYDIQQVELLRGPQGTLYGASTMGGLLKYVSKKPNLSETEVRAGLEFLTIEDAKRLGMGARAQVNAPLVTDKLGVQASIYHQYTPGYIDNALNGNDDENEVRQSGGRFALRWAPNADVTVDLNAMIQSIESENNAYVSLDTVTQEPVGGEGLTSSRVLDQPFEKDVQFFSGRVAWDLGWADFTSVSSFSRTEQLQTQDATPIFGVLFPLLTGGAVPAGQSLFTIQLDLDKYTQEFRLASSGESRLEWLAGAFYTHEDSTNRQLAGASDNNGVPIPGLDPLATVALPTTYEEYAAFGNLTYNFTDRLDVTVGGRVAHNNQDYTQISSGAIIGGDQVVPGESSETVFTYMANASYDLMDQTMIYARVASGYRPGGPNVALPGVPPTVDSDTLVNYEAGVKSEFWDGRALVEATVFWIDWEDIQITSSSGGISFLTNGGTARSRGVEFSSVFSPVDGLRLGANAAYTDSELTEDVPDLQGVDGDSLPGVPEYNASLTADYTWPVMQDWDASAGGGVRFVGERNTNFPADYRNVVIDSYGALDLHAQIANDTWTLRAYVKNVTNEDDFLNVGFVEDGLGGPVELQGFVLQPRTIGVSLDARF